MLKALLKITFQISNLGRFLFGNTLHHNHIWHESPINLEAYDGCLCSGTFLRLG
jgi:hypothetical protein